MGEETMKTKVISGLFWRFLEKGGGQLIQFIVQIILARFFLTPEQYGIVGMITVFILIANVFIQNGFTSALIQKKEVSQLEFTSMFYILLATSIFLYGILYFSAPAISRFYQEPLLTGILRIQALTIIIGAFSSIQNAVMSKRMQFKMIFYRTIGANIVSGIVGVLLAALDYGIWAIVWMNVASGLTGAIIFWITVKWRPSLCFSFRAVKALFSYGYKVLITNMIGTVYDNLYPFVIGKLFGDAQLGLYNKGRSIPSLLVENINGSISSVMFPALSSNQDDPIKIKNIVRRSIMTSCFLIFPMMAGLAAVAKPLVLVLLTDKWIGAVPFIQITCIAFAFWPVHTANLQAINALGRSDISLKLEIVKKIVGVVLLSASLPFGIYVFVGNLAVTSIIALFINSIPNYKLLHYGVRQQAADILPSLLLSAAMAVLVYPISFLPLRPILILPIQILAGAAFYLAGARLMRMEALFYLLTTWKERKKKGAES